MNSREKLAYLSATTLAVLGLTGCSTAVASDKKDSGPSKPNVKTEQISDYTLKLHLSNDLLSAYSVFISRINGNNFLVFDSHISDTLIEKDAVRTALEYMRYRGCDIESLTTNSEINAQIKVTNPQVCLEELK